MKVRLVASPILVLLFSHFAPGQQMPRGVDEAEPPTRVTANAADAYRQKLIRRVAMEEAAVRQAEAAHATNVALSKAYLQLGMWCQNAAQWPRSEAALDHAVALLRHPPGPSADLATAINQLASLHVMMGKLRESEREEQEAMTIRQDIGDPLLIARSWDDLAILYLAQQKYEKARDFARQAEAEFVKNGRSNVLDRVTARFTLAEALCNLKNCPSAIPLLKTALDEAKAVLLPEDFPVGLGNFLLGYAYWKTGNMTWGGEYLERGTTELNAQLGWGHPAYLRALSFYAEFLRENKQVEAANVVERRIRQAQAVVDVHSIQMAQGMFGMGGLR
ncbi:MAG: tetratricopeptide repeat protein [Edaphobacter sp.]|nr:tetratricopeptide repeat protein [Edaphobacter sp.]